MTDPTTALREAFADAGYDVGEVSVNRGQVRVVLLTDQADQESLRALATDAIGDDDILGLNVTTEVIDGQESIGTVVSFRLRS